MEPQHISGEDIRAGRMLLGLSLKYGADHLHISHDTLQRLEAGQSVRKSVKSRVVSELERCGITFHFPGLICHASGPMAPTPTAIGRMRGVRIRRARWRLAWTPERLASASMVPLSLVRSLEAHPDANAQLTLELVRLTSVLQMEGTVFQRPTRHGIGDCCLVGRPILWTPTRNRIRDYIMRGERSPELEWLDEPEDLSKVKPVDRPVLRSDHWHKRLRDHFYQKGVTSSWG